MSLNPEFTGLKATCASREKVSLLFVRAAWIMTHDSNLSPKMIFDLTSLDGIRRFIRYDGKEFYAGRRVSRLVVCDIPCRGIRLIPILSLSFN